MGEGRPVSNFFLVSITDGQHVTERGTFVSVASSRSNNWTPRSSTSESRHSTGTNQRERNDWRKVGYSRRYGTIFEPSCPNFGHGRFITVPGSAVGSCYTCACSATTTHSLLSWKLPISLSASSSTRVFSQFANAKRVHFQHLQVHFLLFALNHF